MIDVILKAADRLRLKPLIVRALKRMDNLEAITSISSYGGKRGLKICSRDRELVLFLRKDASWPELGDVLPAESKRNPLRNLML